MKESYSDDIMLCFVQGFGDGERSYKPRELTESEGTSRLSKKRQQKKLTVQIDNENEGCDVKRSLTAEVIEEAVEFNSRKSDLVTGKSLRLSSGDKFLNRLPEVKRSFSDRFSVITDASGKRPKGLLTIRKTWSTGNFAAGSAGGCGAHRSAPTTPLQLDSHPRSKHDKHAVKPLSGSAPSVRESSTGPVAGDSAEGSKQPSKARQKKFQRHFPQVGPEERVLNYYSCALVGDLLLQGHLYITKNYFAFYSNVFGYVTKLLIPITSVLRITKEKVARIIPNAVGVCTRDERHVFGSLLSRDSTYKLMTHVWKANRVPELTAPKPNQELRASEPELDASEYSPEDDSSSAGGDHVDAPVAPKREEVIATAIHKTGAAVIQPALLTGAPTTRARASHGWRLLALLAALLAASAALAAYRLYTTPAQEDLLKLSGEDLYAELVKWRARLHGRAAGELHSFLSTNLLLLTKVRQSLEALSGVILTDMAAGAPFNIDVPNDTAFS